MARYWVYNAGPFGAGRAALATFSINVAGSFLIGVAYVLLTERAGAAPEWRSLLTVGVLGAFTTYSTYSLDALRMLELGRYGEAASYLFGTMLVCVLAAFAGLVLTRSVI